MATEKQLDEFQQLINQRRSQGTIPCQVDTYKNENTIFLSNQIVVIFRHGLVISFSGNELIREVHYSSTNLFL